MNYKLKQQLKKALHVSLDNFLGYYELHPKEQYDLLTALGEVYHVKTNRRFQIQLKLCVDENQFLKDQEIAKTKSFDAHQN